MVLTQEGLSKKNRYSLMSFIIWKGIEKTPDSEFMFIFSKFFIFWILNFGNALADNHL